MIPRLAAGALYALLLLQTVPANAVAEGTPPPIDQDVWLDYQDNYQYVERGFKPCGYAGAPRKAFREQLRAMAQLLQRTPGLPDPGLTGAISGAWNPCDAAHFGDPRAPAAGTPMQGELLYWPWQESDIVRTPGKRPRSTGETGPVHVRINWIPDPLRSEVSGTDASFGLLPRSAAAVAGFPLQERGRDAVTLLIPAAGHPSPYAAVSLREALMAFLAPSVLEWQRKEKGACGDAARANVTLARSLLTSLDPTALQGAAYQRVAARQELPPACTDAREDYRLQVVAQEGPDTWPLVSINPAYFRSDLPLSAFQILAIPLPDYLRFAFPAEQADERRNFGPTLWAARHFVERVDWQALARTALR